jgi:Domain of unknown function (DUF4234)
MAEVIDIRGSSHPGKIRHPLGIIGLSLITFGIYGAVWYYMVNKELAEIGRANNTDELGDSPGMSVLAITLGAFIIVPPFVSIWNFTKRLDAAERLTGAPQKLEPVILFVLWIFLGFVAMYLTQSSMNNVLQGQAGGGQALGAPQQASQAQQPAAQPAQPPQAS